MKEQIRHFLQTQNPNFSGDEIFGANGIDSMGFLALVSFLEDLMQKELDLSAYDPSEFSTIEGLSRILEELSC